MEGQHWELPNPPLDIAGFTITLSCDVQKSIITNIYYTEGLSRAAKLGRYLQAASREEDFRKGFSAGLAETVAVGSPTIPTCKMATVPFGFGETALAGCFFGSPGKHLAAGSS